MTLVTNPRSRASPPPNGGGGFSSGSILATALFLLCTPFIYLWFDSPSRPMTRPTLIELNGEARDSPFLGPSLRHSTSKGDKAKYLTYGAHWGQSNQLLTLEHALRLAEALNRTLVIPDVLTHNNKGRYRYSALFDLDILRRDIRRPKVMEWHEFTSLNILPVEVIRARHMFKTDVESYWESLGWGHIPHVNHTHLTLTRDVVPFQREYLHYPHQVLAFTSLFVYDDHLRDPVVMDRMLSIVRLSEPFEALARKAVRAVDSKTQGPSQRWTCMHIRRGDFYEHCLVAWAFKTQEYYNMKWDNGSSCYPTLSVIHQNLEQEGLVRDLIYIATDDKSVFKAPEFSGLNLLGLSDVLPPLDGGEVGEVMHQQGIPKGDVLAAMDQAICAAADNLLLNDFSTYSGMREGVKPLCLSSVPSLYC